MTRTLNPAKDFINFLYSKVERETISLFLEAYTPSIDEENPMQDQDQDQDQD